MSTRLPSPSGRAFTLVELIATIAVLGLSVAGALPILSGISDSAHRADAIASERHEVGLALDRIAAIVRPSGNPDAPSTMISTFATDEIRLTDGTGVSLDSSTLVEHDTLGRTHPLARSIERFEVRYLTDDGATPASTATDIHAIEIRIDTTSTSCATRVFLRGRMALP